MEGDEVVSFCVHDKPRKNIQHMSGNIPYLFVLCADQFVHLHLLKSSMDDAPTLPRSLGCVPTIHLSPPPLSSILSHFLGTNEQTKIKKKRPAMAYLKNKGS